MGKRVVVLVSALLLMAPFVGACAPPLTKEEEPTPTPVPTPIVPEKPVYEVKRSVEFLCRVAPVKEQELFFKMNGRVATVDVEKGALVKEGDVLAQLEIQDLLNQMDQARVDLEKAQLALEAARRSVEEQLADARRNLESAQIRLEQSIQQQEYAIAQAQVDLDNALIRLQQARSQDPQLAVREAEANLEKARIALQEAQMAYAEAMEQPGGSSGAAEAYQRALIDYELAEARYEAVKAAAADASYTIALLENAVESARLRLKQLQTGPDPLLVKAVEAAQREVDRLEQGVDPLLEKNVETAQLRLDRLAAQVDSARIVAPFDGQVTGVLVFEGREAQAYKPVIVIAEPGALELSCDLTSSVLQRVAEGMKADIVFSDFPGEQLSGTLRRLPYPYGGGGRSADVQQEDKSTRISFDDTKGRQLESGQLAKVRVIIEKKDDALFLPPQAIRTFEGRRFVVVQDEEGRQRRVDVKVGIVSPDRVEILEGLEAGQVVIGP